MSQRLMHGAKRLAEADAEGRGGRGNFTPKEEVLGCDMVRLLWDI